MKTNRLLSQRLTKQTSMLFFQKLTLDNYMKYSALKLSEGTGKRAEMETAGGVDL